MIDFWRDGRDMIKEPFRSFDPGQFPARSPSRTHRAKRTMILRGKLGGLLGHATAVMTMKRHGSCETVVRMQVLLATDSIIMRNAKPSCSDWPPAQWRWTGRSSSATLGRAAELHS